jgi:serine/threonine protein kinase
LERHSDDGECTSISPYVLKRLRDRDDMSESQYLVGMRDLRKEAIILAELKHDNIIRLYHGNCPTRTDPKNLFLVLERFEKSLDYQIALWDRHRHISNKLYQDMITDQQRSISTDISSAMNYLHERK